MTGLIVGEKVLAALFYAHQLNHSLEREKKKTKMRKPINHPQIYSKTKGKPQQLYKFIAVIKIFFGGEGGNLTPDVWLNEIQFISSAINPATLREERDCAETGPAWAFSGEHLKRVSHLRWSSSRLYALNGRQMLF